VIIFDARAKTSARDLQRIQRHLHDAMIFDTNQTHSSHGQANGSLVIIGWRRSLRSDRTSAKNMAERVNRRFHWHKDSALSPTNHLITPWNKHLHASRREDNWHSANHHHISTPCDKSHNILRTGWAKKTALGLLQGWAAFKDIYTTLTKSPLGLSCSKPETKKWIHKPCELSYTLRPSMRRELPLNPNGKKSEAQRRLKNVAKLNSKRATI